MVLSNNSALSSIIFITSSAISGSNLPVLESVQLYNNRIVLEKLLVVFLCKLLTAIRLANKA